MISVCQAVARKFIDMISSYLYSSSFISNVQMVKLRFRERWYIPKGHMTDKYLSCDCAKELGLIFLVLLSPNITSLSVPGFACKWVLTFSQRKMNGIFCCCFSLACFCQRLLLSSILNFVLQVGQGFSCLQVHCFAYLVSLCFFISSYDNRRRIRELG